MIRIHCQKCNCCIRVYGYISYLVHNVKFPFQKFHHKYTELAIIFFQNKVCFYLFLQCFFFSLRGRQVLSTGPPCKVPTTRAKPGAENLIQFSHVSGWNPNYQNPYYRTRTPQALQNDSPMNSLTTRLHAHPSTLPFEKQKFIILMNPLCQYFQFLDYSLGDI